MDRNDRWDGQILDYSKGGEQGAASCRSFNWPLAVSPFLMFLYSYFVGIFLFYFVGVFICFHVRK